MPIATADLQKLYIAFFNRPADVAGLAFWTAQADVGAVARAMAGSPEFQASHAGMGNAAVVTSLYQNLFGRAPDPAGLAFWLDALDRGVLSPATLAAELARVTQGNDGATLANKATLAAGFTVALDTPGEQAVFEANLGSTAVKALLNGVGADGASLSAAQNSVAGTIAGLFPVVTPPPVTPPTPQILTLTSAPDDVASGGAGDDTIFGTNDTYQTTDVIDGGAGVDTLALTINDTIGALNGANIRNVERLSVTTTQIRSIDVGSLVGITELVNDNSTGAGLSFGLVFQPATALPQLARLTITGGTSATTLHIADAALAGAADDLKVVLSNTGATLRSLTLLGAGGGANQLESVSIEARGVNALALVTDTAQTSLQTVRISGGGVLTLALDHDWTRQQIRTIEAGSATGSLTLGTSAKPLTATTTSIHLGSGDDVIFMGAGLTAASVVDSGGGNDTLVVTTALTSATAAGLSGVEVVRLDATGAAIVQDASLVNLRGVAYEVLGSGNGVTLNGLASGTAVTLTGALATLQQSLADVAPTNDRLVLKLGGNVALGTLVDVAGLDVMTIAVTGTANAITSDQVAARHVITGSGALAIGGSLQATAIDASGFSGALQLQLGSGVTTFLGGTGADSITAGSGAATYRLSAPGTNASTGADRIILGGDPSQIVFGGIHTDGDGAAMSYAPFATISQFSPASDRLVFSADDNDFRLGAHAGLAKGGIAQGLTAGDALVVQTVNGATNAVALADVGYFKLTRGSSTNGDVATKFAQSLGTATVSGLAADGNYLISMYDFVPGRTVIGVVNVGADGILSRADLTASGVAIVGVLDDGGQTLHSSLSATNLLVAS